MAIVKGPLMGAEARGRVGGVVHNTWRGRSYVKAKTAPSQPRTHLQLALRALAIKIARLWQSESQANQLLWNDYANAHTEKNWTGTSVRLTGANWYQRLNTRLARLSATLIHVPPSDIAPIPAAGATLVGGSGSLVLSWTATGESNTKMNIWADGPHSKGAQPRQPKSNYVDDVTMATATYAFVTPGKGRWDVWFRSLNTTTGLVSGWQVCSADVS